jgi:hypothetical protein
MIQHSIWKETIAIPKTMSLSRHTLPVELVYRILDHLNNKSIFLSCTNVCRRLNDIIDSYHRYQVIPSFTFRSRFDCLSSALFFFCEYVYRRFPLESFPVFSYLTTLAAIKNATLFLSLNNQHSSQIFMLQFYLILSHYNINPRIE